MTAAQRVISDVDKVAEAIWRHDPFRMGNPDHFTGEGDQQSYRTMAVAVMETLGLAEEWRTTGWIGPVAESLARSQAESAGSLQRRLVSQWTPAS